MEQMMTSFTSPTSRYAQEAIALLASLIRAERIEKQIPVSELAERAGISRGTLHRIEQGDVKCQIGSYFEIAAILGIPLFDTEVSLPSLVSHRNRVEEKLKLLPKHTSKIKSSRKVKDDF
ncbi:MULTISPECIES: helix-turn-helix domain-containing protein [Pantoea]|uniref:Helix-turn-helix transcriptional regulator n=1 Tax=Pantoea trifolii TaxID=2968030 RepID=A0ABT1VKN0_9GAMM|nr:MULTISPECIES: helix-turn-helix transcriptional regulator [unclassified Pantoea]MCQ8227731.1 helix-turn-helix transcriptional regulator [Pantoea sp. MMK2]MCQ8235904.1 helix-turn-helix transcriptional regulator [Pantoea sp. MMK3]